jgi:DNA-binding response OmpR family regulator
MEGFTVSMAFDGESAITFLDTHSPDLIITDLLMPGVNGIEFIQHVRSSEHNKHIPIILLTAQTGMENRLAGVNAGANVFMQKPFDEGDLLNSIEALIQK